MANPNPPALPLALLTLALAGCSQPAPPLDPNVLVPPPTPPARRNTPAAPAEAKPADAAAANLAPLATPQQVAGAVDLGRLDPFGALPPRFPSLLGPDGKPLPPTLAGGGSSGATGPAGATAATAAASRAGGRPSGPGARGPAPALPPLQLPNGFSVSGVIRSGGISEAVVSYGALSGSLRPGDRGGRTTDLLPSGWSVAAVDVNRGLITLQKDGRRVSAEL